MTIDGWIMRTPLIHMLVLAMLLVMGCAASQEDIVTLDGRLGQLEGREADLRTDFDQYRSDREQKDQALRTQSASLLAQVEELRQEIRVINGKLDEIGHAAGQPTAAGGETPPANLNELNAATRRNEERIAQLEQILKVAPPPAAAAAPVVAATPPATGPSAEELYQAAKTAFDREDYGAARKKFQTFLDKYPSSDNADNAQFWIGESYYREKQYEKAILEYQKVIENYPKGNKVAASLLKQGFAFYNLGDKTNSRLILEELIRKQPNSNEAKIAAEKLKSF
jgi:tol-pal system protein YbgF